jgi:hypothetical protein
MGRRKPSKSRAPSGTGRKTGGEGVAAAAQAAEPTKVQMPSWFDEVPSYLALAFIALALATIPYGAPVPGWYMWLMASVVAALAMSLATDPQRRWRTLTAWPILVIVGAWVCAVATCRFPGDIIGRASSLAWFSPILIAAQVTCWRKRTIKALVACVIILTLVIAVDLWWQLSTTRSLIREIRAMHYKPDGSINFLTLGSLGNQNDQAVTAILLPLCACLLPSWWAWCLLVLGAIPTGYLAIAGKSRQLALGAIVAVSTLVGLHSKPKVRFWAITVLVLAAAAVFAAAPGLRARFASVAENPLGNRALPIMYGIDLFANNPVFGVGPSLYGHYYVQGVREGWTFFGEPLEPVGTPWVHSLPVEIACEMGILGLIAFGVVIWKFGFALSRGVRAGGPARDMSIAVTASAFAMAATGMIDLSFIKDWVCMVWWLVLGLGFAAPLLPGGAAVPIEEARLPVDPKRDQSR